MPLIVAGVVLILLAIFLSFRAGNRGERFSAAKEWTKTYSVVAGLLIFAGAFRLISGRPLENIFYALLCVLVFFELIDSGVRILCKKLDQISNEVMDIMERDLAREGGL